MNSPVSRQPQAPSTPPSEWVQRWTHLLPQGAHVLDVACGSGRHLQWFAQHGCAVVGIDRDVSGASHMTPSVTLVQADLENAPWPLIQDACARTFAAVVVTNYLWRPLFPVLLDSLAPGGVLIYETFANGNAEFGKPSRPDFLLQPGELLELCSALHIVAYENGFLPHPARLVQRIVAVRSAPNEAFGRSVVHPL